MAAILESHLDDDGEEVFSLTDFGLVVRERLMGATHMLALDMNRGVDIGIPHTHPGWDGLLPTLDQLCY